MIESFEWTWMYHPLKWNVFVTAIDWNDYVVVYRMKLRKDTVYKDKETFLDSIKPHEKPNNRWTDK
jgi:hypothetical protein